MFHEAKFPLEKAFLMMYLISTHKKGFSTLELALQFGVKKTTAWFFKRKGQQAMKPKGMRLLEGIIDVDETAVGGKEKESKAEVMAVRKLSSGPWKPILRRRRTYSQKSLWES